VHALHCSVTQRSQSIPVSISPSSDESRQQRKQSLYPDGDLDCHQNLMICLLAHCQHSLKISGKSIQKFLHKVANEQTNNNENISSLAELIKGKYEYKNLAV